MDGASVDFSGENVFTDPVRVKDEGVFSFEGTFVATITIQCKPDGGDNWIDVETFTNADDPRHKFAGFGDLHRAGIKTGDYTSGSGTIYLKG